MSSNTFFSQAAGHVKPQKRAVALGLCLVAMLSLWQTRAAAQATRTLAECLDATAQHLPVGQQTPLIEAANKAVTTNLRRNHWPQASLNGQATWQTDVTELPIQVPIPGFEVPSLSRDQYRLTLDVAHSLWDGGQNNSLIAMQDAQTRTELQRVNVDRYAAREQVIQFYCAALLAQTQLQTINAARSDVSSRKNRVDEQINNGSAIPAQSQLFEARLLELEQQADEALARKSAAFDALALFSGIAFNPRDSLLMPVPAASVAAENARPELTLFSLQQQSMLTQEQLAQAKLKPRVNAIATLGYARPGLNFLSNDFAPYAVFGLNFKWNLNPLYTGSAKREKQQYRLQSERISAQKDQFLLQNELRLQQQKKDMERLEAQIAKDQRIIRLRESIAATAAVQLDGGVITASEYLTESTNITTARLNARLHEIQLLQARLMANYLLGQ